MHVFLLNKGNAIQPTDLPYRGTTAITGYSSMIWTERFRDYGEFQMNIPYDSPLASTFYPGSLLGRQGSSQVMLAETQQENINDQGYREIVVTGRSAESIIEDRVLWAPPGAALTLARSYNYLDAALLYIWQAVMNSSTADVGSTVARPAEISSNSTISDAIVTDSTKLTGLKVKKVNVNVGQIGPTVRNFLNSINCGIRCVRPLSTVNNVSSISVTTANGPNKGLITRTALSGTSDKLRFDVYRGTDRSKTPPVSDNLVYLSEEAGHLDNVDVTTTYREFITNTVHGVDATHYYGASGGGWRGDFDVRHRYIDASGLVSGMPPADHVDIIDDAEAVYFQTHSNRGVLTADLTSGTPYIFGTDYYLGDTIMLKYRKNTRRSLVNEYTWVDDREGSREYPGFLGWDEITSGVIRDW